MKKKNLIIASLLSCFIAGYLLIVPSVFASEEISDWQSDIVVNTDGTIKVQETITYFFDVPRHGIFRTIPTVKTNQDNKQYQVDVKVQSVTDENGAAYNYVTSFEGTNLKIQIGDANKTITGTHIYKINYTVSGALTYFSDHDELYWNVTGNDWQVAIEKASVTVTLPEKGAGGIKTICYTGKSGSGTQLCQSVQLSPSSAQIETTQSLAAYEGLTFASSFPKGIVAVLEPKEYGKKTALDALIAVLIVIGVIFWYILLPIIVVLWWYFKGRDPKVGKPVTAWYDPPKDKTGRLLTPGETGTVVDEKVDNRDLTATIVSLAIKGYLTIKEEKKTGLFGSTTYRFIKKKEYEKDNSLQSHERMILNELFSDDDEITTKELEENSFYLTYNKFQKDLYQKVVTLGYFLQNPNSVRTKYMIFSGLALFLGGNFLLAIVLAIVGYNMPKKTLEGAQARAVALGLKNFLVSQERQLEFQAKNWFMFEKLLPFAIIFGVEKIWAERFKDLNVQPPDWYQGNWSTFNTVYFANSLSNSLSSMNSLAMSPTRSSSGFSSGFSGGGSSGGGGGGGGGGSW